MTFTCRFGHYDVPDMARARDLGKPARGGLALAPEPVRRAVPGVVGANGAPRSRGEHPARVVSAKITLRRRLVELWGARELLLFLVRKELKVKYRSSVLGFLWSMINPAIVLGVYYVVFKYFMRSAIPDFALFLFSGLIIWNFFGAALQGSASSVVGAAGIVKKVAFPREVLPLAQVGTALFFFFLQSLVLVLFLAGFQFAPAWGYLPLVAFGLVDLVILTAGVGIFLAGLNVTLRDIEHLIAVLLQAWFWGVPVIYSYNTVYDLFARHHLQVFSDLYLLDPVTPIVLAFQRALYGRVSYTTKVPTATDVHGLFKVVDVRTTSIVLATYPYHFFLEMLGAVLVGALVIFFLAMKFFGSVEGNFAEEL